jgi:hypothetical protein
LKKTKTVMAPSRIKNSLDPKNISEIFNLRTDVILLEWEKQNWRMEHFY